MLWDLKEQYFQSLSYRIFFDLSNHHVGRVLESNVIKGHRSNLCSLLDVDSYKLYSLGYEDEGSAKYLQSLGSNRPGNHHKHREKWFDHVVIVRFDSEKHNYSKRQSSHNQETLKCNQGKARRSNMCLGACL